MSITSDVGNPPANTWLATKNSDQLATAMDRYLHDPRLERDRGYTGDAWFGLWMHVANQKCQRLIGLGIHDLEDWTWRDAYDAGNSPFEALRDALGDLGYSNDDED